MAATSGDSALKVWVVLNKAQAAVEGHARAHAASRGLTPQEFGVLEVLYHKGDLLLGELQDKLLVTSGGVTYIVDRLEEKGLVRRLACKTDRRARYASLTAKGRRLIEQVFPEHVAWLDRALGGLSVAEREQATALLRRLGRHAADTEPGP